MNYDARTMLVIKHLIMTCLASEETYLHPNLSSSSDKQQQQQASQHISRKVCHADLMMDFFYFPCESPGCLPAHFSVSCNQVA